MITVENQILTPFLIRKESYYLVQRLIFKYVYIAKILSELCLVIR